MALVFSAIQLKARAWARFGRRGRRTAAAGKLSGVAETNPYEGQADSDVLTAREG